MGKKGKEIFNSLWDSNPVAGITLRRLLGTWPVWEGVFRIWRILALSCPIFVFQCLLLVCLCSQSCFLSLYQLIICVTGSIGSHKASAGGGGCCDGGTLVALIYLMEHWYYIQIGLSINTPCKNPKPMIVLSGHLHPLTPMYLLNNAFQNNPSVPFSLPLLFLTFSEQEDLNSREMSHISVLVICILIYRSGRWNFINKKIIRIKAGANLRFLRELLMQINWVHVLQSLPNIICLMFIDDHRQFCNISLVIKLIKSISISLFIKMFMNVIGFLSLANSNFKINCFHF